MKKNLNFAIILVITVFLTVFSVAFAITFYKGKFKKPAMPHSQRELATHPSESTTKSDSQRMVFYSNVGSSSQSNSHETQQPSNKIVSRYTIEVAQFASQSEAEKLLLQLKSRGVDGFYTPVRRGPEVIYRVRLGIYASPDDAQQNLTKIATKTQIKGTVAKLQ